MQYIVGIDAGATKTHIKIADIKGNIIMSGKTIPGNINAISQDMFGSALCKEIEALLAAAGLKKKDCLSMCMGAAGCGNTRNKEMYMGILESTELGGVKTAETDAMTALVGAIGERRGIILISGTGSICFGINDENICFRAGGWGHIIGDEGSGYYIGCLVLKSIMEAYDKNERSLLKEWVFKDLNITTHNDLIEYVYNPATAKKDIAYLAQICNMSYDYGDDLAKVILEKAGMELAGLLKTVYNRAFGGKGLCRWSYGGSIIEKCRFVRECVCREVSFKYPSLEMAAPKNDSAYGAVLIALEGLKN